MGRPLPTDTPSRDTRGRTAVVFYVIDTHNCIIFFVNAIGGPEPAYGIDEVTVGQRVYVTYEPELNKWFIT